MSLLTALLVAALTICSGLLDARGFAYAPRAWQRGQFEPHMALLSALCFLAGLALYIVAVRFMQKVGVASVTVQSAIWFVATAIGIAVLDGSVLSWTRLQQLVGLGIFAGLAWLISTTAATGTN
jgi:hypothetical protein